MPFLIVFKIPKFFYFVYSQLSSHFVMLDALRTLALFLHKGANPEQLIWLNFVSFYDLFTDLITNSIQSIIDLRNNLYKNQLKKRFE